MPLERHGLRWVHPEACYAHPLPGGARGRALPRRRRDRGEPRRADPGDGERWRGVRGAVRSSTSTPCGRRCSPASRPSRGPLRLLAALGPGRHARLRPAAARARPRPRPAAVRGRRRARRGCTARPMHGDVAARQAGQRDRRRLPQPARPRRRLAQPGGRRRAAHRRARRLPARARRRDPHRRARVARSRSSGGRVTGVRRRRRARAGRRSSSPTSCRTRSLAMAATRCRGRTARCCGATATAPATLKVDWALDGPIPWTREAARGAGTVHVGGDEDEIARARSRVARTACPSARSCCSASSRVADPTRAPAGKHTAWAYTHGPQHGVDWAAEQDAPRRARSRRRSSASRRASATASSPATCSARPTWRRATRNLVGGDVGGGSYGSIRSSSGPIPSLSPYRTPLARPVPGQRRGVPRRRGARRARRRRRARRDRRSGSGAQRAQGAAPAAESLTHGWSPRWTPTSSRCRRGSAARRGRRGGCAWSAPGRRRGSWRSP